MNRWAIVAIPLMFCVLLIGVVVGQFVADRAFCRAKDRIAEYEREYALYSKGKRERPAPITSLEPLLNRAVKLEPDCAEYHNYLGRYYQALAADVSLSDAPRAAGLAKQAVEEYEKAVKLEPLNGVYHAYLAYMQGMVGEHTKAVAGFEEAIRLNRSNRWIRRLYDAYRKWTVTVEDVPGPSGSAE